MEDDYRNGNRQNRPSREYRQQREQMQRRRPSKGQPQSRSADASTRSYSSRSTRQRAGYEHDARQHGDYQRSSRQREAYERNGRERERNRGNRGTYDRDSHGYARRQRQQSSYDARRSHSEGGAPLSLLLQNKKLLAIIAAVIVLLVIVFAIRGCGSDGDRPQQAANATAASSADQTSATAAPRAAETSPNASSRAGETSSDASATAQTTASQNAGQSAAATKVDAKLLINGAEAGVALGNEARKGDFSISVATTGDIMFAREVGNYVEEHGGAAALANVAPELSAADVTIANLECPLTDDESEALYGKDVLWRSNPKGIDGLTSAGIDVVSLANNHIMDYGGAGLSDTLTALDGAGILHAGAGMNENDAAKPAELKVGNISIAFFSWTDIIPDFFISYDDNPGVVSARLNMEDACKRVSEAKKNHDIVIVAMHWGTEYQDYISDYQQQDPGHRLVDAGADVVWGNHPHVIEGIELYNGSLISYSQGDFVCDHYSRETGESFILTFNITRDGIQDIVATPVYLDDENGIPSIVTGDDAANILERLERISEGMNTSFALKNDKAYITEA